MRKAMPYESTVPMEHGDIGAALQQFVLESEQVLTQFSLVSVVSDDGGVIRAGGLMVQALPGWEHEHLEKITKCLEEKSFSSLVRGGASPFAATSDIFEPLGLIHVGDDPLAYECRCSLDAAINAVKLLSPDELETIRKGRIETVTCEFCGLSYEVGASQLDKAGG
jgi:molecular chaperone Hsp33